MAHEPEVIHVDPGSELDRILEAAGDRPVVLRRKGIRYRLNRESLKIADENDPWKDYDPERALAATRAAAGAWSDIDTEEMKAYLRRAREEGSRPADWPNVALPDR